MIEFEALGGMHGHELHRVAHFLFEVDRTAGLLEVIQVLDKFLQALRFALGLPLAHELREAIEVFAVFAGRGRTDFECLGEIVE